MMLLDATPSSEKPVYSEKTAPRDFFWKYESAPSKSELEALIDAGENDPCNYKTALGVVEYGYRYYNPQMGRWLSRDPIEEAGGLNLYGFVDNDGINYWDYLGLSGQSIFDEGITYEISKEKIKEIVGEECYCRLRFNSVAFNIKGGLGMGADDWEQQFDKMEDIANQISWVPTSLNPVDVLIHFGGKIIGTPDVATGYAAANENMKLNVNLLPQFEARTNIDYDILVGYERRFFGLGPEDPSRPIYESGRSSLTVIKPEFQPGAPFAQVAMALMIKEGRGSEIYEEILLSNSPVQGNVGVRFDYYEDAVASAFQQLENYLKFICKR